MKFSWKDVLPLLVPVVIIGGLALLVLNAPKASELSYIPVERTGSDVVVGGQVAGKKALITSANIKSAGFITVHESMSGAPAQIIGSSALLEPGEHTDITIGVTPETLPGYRYIVLLMEDDGDGVYEPGIDVPVMSDGKVIKRDFVTNSEE